MKFDTIVKTRIRIVATVVFALLTVAWMGVIFGFSASTEDVSETQSNSVTRLMIDTFVDDAEKMSEPQRADLVTKYDPFVRKLAHFAVYAVLGILTYFTFGSADKRILQNPVKPCMLSVPLCILFSISDEIHQIFIKGRSGKFTDVLIDSAGIIFGTAVVIGIIALVVKRRK